MNLNAETECNYAECLLLSVTIKFFMLNVLMLSVMMLNVNILNAIMLNVVTFGMKLIKGVYPTLSHLLP